MTERDETKYLFLSWAVANGLLMRWLRNVVAVNSTFFLYDNIFRSDDGPVHIGFAWVETAEGYDYWRDVNIRFHDLNKRRWNDMHEAPI